MESILLFFSKSTSPESPDKGGSDKNVIVWGETFVHRENRGTCECFSEKKGCKSFYPIWPGFHHMVCKRDALTLIIAEKEIIHSGNRHEKEAYQVDNYKKRATYPFCHHWRNPAGMPAPDLCGLHLQGFVGLFRIMSFAFHGIFYDRVLFCVAAFLFTKKAITVLPGAIGPCNRIPFSFDFLRGDGSDANAPCLQSQMTVVCLPPQRIW